MPSLIQPDLHIVGTLTSQGDIEVRGHVEGEIRAANFFLDKTGTINGTLRAGTAIIEGNFTGEILADKVRICAGAHVQGRIENEILTVEFGAVLEGKIEHAIAQKFEAAKPAPVRDQYNSVLTLAGAVPA